MAKTIQWKRGTTAQNDAFTGAAREITVDTTKGTVRVHDGSTAGGSELARVADVPTKLSQLTNDTTAWERTALTALEQLSNDIGLVKKANLSKLSQLTNDRNFKTAHCSYCTHCTYCSQCSKCLNCTTINCTTVQCTQVQCNEKQCTWVDYCNCQCNACDCQCGACDCGDDGG